MQCDNLINNATVNVNLQLLAQIPPKIEATATIAPKIFIFGFIVLKILQQAGHSVHGYNRTSIFPFPMNASMRTGASGYVQC